ncbi:hypothetical protein BV25DRAFT_1843430, partial [Artomyces pyxidatus]
MRKKETQRPNPYDGWLSKTRRGRQNTNPRNHLRQLKERDVTKGADFDLEAALAVSLLVDDARALAGDDDNDDVSDVADNASDIADDASDIGDDGDVDENAGTVTTGVKAASQSPQPPVPDRGRACQKLAHGSKPVTLGMKRHAAPSAAPPAKRRAVASASEQGASVATKWYASPATTISPRPRPTVADEEEEAPARRATPPESRKQSHSSIRRKGRRDILKKVAGASTLPCATAKAIGKHSKPDALKAAIEISKLPVANGAFVATGGLPPTAKSYEGRIVAL